PFGVHRDGKAKPALLGAQRSHRKQSQRQTKKRTADHGDRQRRGLSLTRERAQSRSSFRSTNLRPDHVSVTAHTLMSTKSRWSATSRIVLSVISVGSFAAFFGQETQMQAS